MLDANIWRAERLLTSEFGEALFHRLKEINGFIGFSEVVAEELDFYASKTLDRIQSSVTRQLAEVQLLTGVPLALDFDLIHHRHIHTRLHHVFGDRLKFLPITIAHVNDALRRVVQKLAPAHNGEEFRDALIWNAAVSCVRDAHVILVTQDKAFFKDGHYESGLAVDLQHYGLQCYTTLKDVLDSLQSSSDLSNDTDFVSLIEHLVRPVVNRLAMIRNFNLGPRSATSVSVYPTIDRNFEAVAYDMLFNLSMNDLYYDAEPPPTVTVEGRGMYNVTKRELSGSHIEKIIFRWSTPHSLGREPCGATYVATMGNEFEISISQHTTAQMHDHWWRTSLRDLVESAGLALSTPIQWSNSGTSEAVYIHGEVIDLQAWPDFCERLENLCRTSWHLYISGPEPWSS